MGLNIFLHFIGLSTLTAVVLEKSVLAKFEVRLQTHIMDPHLARTSFRRELIEYLLGSGQFRL